MRLPSTQLGLQLIAIGSGYNIRTLLSARKDARSAIRLCILEASDSAALARARFPRGLEAFERYSSYSGWQNTG